MPRESTGNAPRSHPRHAKRSETARQSCGAHREQKVDRKAERNRTGQHLVTIRERRSRLWCAKPLGLSEQARPAALPFCDAPFRMSPRPLGEFHLAVLHTLVWRHRLRRKGQVNVLAVSWCADEANKCYNFNHGTPPSFAEPPPPVRGHSTRTCPQSFLVFLTVSVEPNRSSLEIQSQTLFAEFPITLHSQEQCSTTARFEYRR